MNTTFPKGWNPHLYLDALGSASVIAISVLIFLAAAAVALSDAVPQGAQAADACPVGRYATLEYADQRPGAPQTPDRGACA